MRPASVKNLNPTFQDAKNVSSTMRTDSAKSLSPSIPLSALGLLITVTAARGEGEEMNGDFFPRVEQVASCDLFYPGLLLCHPFGVL